MHLSIPAEDRIVRIGPNLPGDVNGDGVVNFADLSGFAEGLLKGPGAPLPVVTSDMNGDGCGDGLDVQLFVDELLGG
jgi:hypothetical protein